MSNQPARSESIALVGSVVDAYAQIESSLARAVIRIPGTTVVSHETIRAWNTSALKSIVMRRVRSAIRLTVCRVVNIYFNITMIALRRPRKR